MQQIKTSPRVRQVRDLPIHVIVIGWLTTNHGARFTRLAIAGLGALVFSSHLGFVPYLALLVVFTIAAVIVEMGRGE